MKKLQLKKEVIANLDNQTSKMVKGGTNTTITTAIPSMYPTCSYNAGSRMCGYNRLCLLLSYPHRCTGDMSCRDPCR